MAIWLIALHFRFATENTLVSGTILWLSGAGTLLLLSIFLVLVGFAIQSNSRRLYSTSLLIWTIFAMLAYCLVLIVLTVLAKADLNDVSDATFSHVDFVPYYTVALLLFVFLFGPTSYYWLRILKRST
jgi:bacteriorhodopsin